MFVAVLSHYPDEISGALDEAGDSWAAFDTIEEVQEADFVISYGYRHIIRKPHISRFGDRLINLHISHLPWNRGADPNLWSFIDGTPKGVSIHIVDEGLDTGPILIQREVHVSGTLATSYQQLRDGMRALFAESWKAIRAGALMPRPQERASGSHHRSADKQDIWARLPLGFATPIVDVEALGQALRGR
jgi:methionyl-tRNA formyltransferase